MPAVCVQTPEDKKSNTENHPATWWNSWPTGGPCCRYLGAFPPEASCCSFSFTDLKVENCEILQSKIVLEPKKCLEPHNFHMWVWWIFNWPVNKDSSSSKWNSAFQKVCQPARCSPHGEPTVMETLRWASGLAQRIWSVRHSPKPPLAPDKETGSLRSRGASHWIVVSELGEALTPAFPPLCLFECESIRGRFPEIHANPLYYWTNRGSHRPLWNSSPSLSGKDS